MDLLFRYKPDGSRAYSYFVYLGFFVIAVVAVFGLHQKTLNGANRSATVRGGHVGHITQQAAMIEPVHADKIITPTQVNSFRLPEELENKTVQASEVKEPKFSPIAAALTDPQLSSDVFSATENKGYKVLIPAFPPDKIKSITSALKDEGSTLGDHINSVNYYDPELTANEAHQTAPIKVNKDRSLVYSVPRGSTLEVCLLSTVDTSNPGAIIECALVNDLVFNHVKQIDFGVHILGKLAGNPARGRINISFDTIVTPLGLEVPINASVVECDESLLNYRPGIAAELILPPNWVQASPYIAEVVTGFLGYFKSRVNTPVVVTAGVVNFQSTAADELKRAGAQASATAIEDLAVAKQRQWNEMYGAYYLVHAGTLCSLQLQADLDLHRLHEL